MPHFISVIVLVGMLSIFLSPSSGIIGHIYRTLGLEAINFMGVQNTSVLFMYFPIYGSIPDGTASYNSCVIGNRSRIYMKRRKWTGKQMAEISED